MLHAGSEHRKLARFGVRYMEETRNVAAQIQKRMHSDTGLVRTVARPRKQRQAQLDGGGVQRVDRVGKLHAEAVVRVELAREANQVQCEILIDAPVARLVGIGQGAARDATADTQVIELGRVRTQARFDVAQALAKGELRKGHAQKLIQVRERQRRIATRVLRHTAPKRVQRQMLHQLSKHQLPRMHRSAPGKSRQLLSHSNR